jgi:hypothetical protein
MDRAFLRQRSVETDDATDRAQNLKRVRFRTGGGHAASLSIASLPAASDPSMEVNCLSTAFAGIRRPTLVSDEKSWRTTALRNWNLCLLEFYTGYGCEAWARRTEVLFRTGALAYDFFRFLKRPPEA